MKKAVYYIIPFLSVPPLLSPENRSIDFVITVAMPAALFLFMFLVGFLETRETVVRFDLRHALKVSLEDTPCFLYAGAALMAFCASFKPFRIHRKE